MTLNPLRAPIVAALLAAMAGVAQAEPQTYVIDPAHTAVAFHVDHFGFSRPSGKFMGIEGKLVLDQENPAASSVEVTIPVDQVNTGVPKLDDHLKTADFFDVAQFPTATFVSTSVEPTSDATATVTGDLTLHGVTRPVTLEVVLNKIAKNPFGKDTAGFSATAVIKRSDFGVSAYLPGLGDEVMLEIDSESNL